MVQAKAFGLEERCSRIEGLIDYWEHGKDKRETSINLFGSLGFRGMRSSGNSAQCVMREKSGTRARTGAIKFVYFVFFKRRKKPRDKRPKIGLSSLAEALAGRCRKDGGRK